MIPEDSFYPPEHCVTLVDLLRWRALQQAGLVVYSFLSDGESPDKQLTYAELDRSVRSIAAMLQQHVPAGTRILLLYPSGLEFIAAFFGCLYAGCVAIPTYPPGSKHHLGRLEAIVNNAQPSLVLTTQALLPTLQQNFALGDPEQRLPFLATDLLDGQMAEEWQAPAITEQTLAFLQYTSGSTGHPKGVMVNHRNLLHNHQMIQAAMAYPPGATIVSWLPFFHDMGLIGNILQAVYAGAHCVLMAPQTVIQKPFAWLRAISRYQAYTSWAPNFAYDLCVQKISAEQRAQLDLSHWKVALNAAEPVKAATILRFSEMFAPCGFAREAFVPGYGLAEATLFVATGTLGMPPTFLSVQSQALNEGKVVEALLDEPQTHAVVGCGHALLEQKIAIVDPETATLCPPDRVGEIWVSGTSIAQGYWRRAEESQKTFQAFLLDTGEGPFLRTGDLGFYRDDDLFIVSRLKDLIIVRGQNHYPQDIEQTAEQSHPALILGCGTAFSVEVAGEEQLVIVHEVHRHFTDYETVFAMLRLSIAQHHNLPVYAIALIRQGSIPKTSSGKLQRRASRDQFIADSLKIVASSVLPPAELDEEGLPSLELLLSGDELERLTLLLAALQKLVVQIFRTELPAFDRDASFLALGLDSLMLAELKNRIEAHLTLSIPIERFFEQGSIQQFATWLLQQLSERRSNPLPLLTPETEVEQGHFPLSSTQWRLWFLTQLESERALYHEGIALLLQGVLHKEALKQSVNTIIRRHSSLRTFFPTIGGQVVQQVLPGLPLTVEEIDLSTAPEAEHFAQAREAIEAEIRRPLDLTEHPPVKVSLFRLADDQHVLFALFHHIIGDAWSLGIFYRELAELYRSAVQEETAMLTALPFQYRDYVAWQRTMQSADVLQRQLAYWKQQLAGAPPVLELPLDHPRPVEPAYRGTHYSFSLPAELLSELKKLSLRENATLFMVLLSAFQVLLARYSGQQDILVGVPVTERAHVEFENLIGCFVNTLVLRGDFQGNPTYREFLGRVRKATLEAYAYAAVPLEQLVATLQPERSRHISPFFQVMFVMDRDTWFQSDLPGLTVTPFDVESGISKFDLTLSITDAGKGTIEYNTDLFERESVVRLVRHWQMLLAGIVADPGQRVANLPLLSVSEKEHLLQVQSNVPVTDYEQSACLHQLFERQAAATPHAIALMTLEHCLTYQEVERRANQLAHYLAKLSSLNGMRVGVYMEPTLETIVGVLAILKAGGVYVPLDSHYPAERIAFMLADADVAVVLTQESLKAALPVQTLPLVVLEEDWFLHSLEPETALQKKWSTFQEAYLIYTSGSTGRPKGVQVSHQGLQNLAEVQVQRFALQPDDHVLQFSSLSFDASIWEITMALATGATLCLKPTGTVFAGQLLLDLLEKLAISVVTLPPSLLASLPSTTLPHLRTLIVAGEACPPELIKIWAGSRNFFNAYGPTESTVCATIAACDATNAQHPPIGKAIARTQAIVLDQQLEVVPPGVVGTLYLSGVHLAQGYINRPEITSERFIPHPFSSVAGQRLYNTGDLAYTAPDGTLYYAGRQDQQVKVRGLRIELEEIEAVLLRYPGIREAIVLVHEKTRLIAYLTLKEQEEVPEVDLLRYFLKQYLPDYMLPATFTVLPQLPLTPNNKIDRSLLLKQAGDQFQRSAATFVPPSTEIERTIAAVWQKALGLERIGRHENFFDLGGHSLLAVEVIQKLQQELNCQITAVQLFNYATVALLAQYLSQSTPVEHTAQQKADQRDMLQAGKNRLQVQRQRRLKGQEVIEK